MEGGGIGRSEEHCPLNSLSGVNLLSSQPLWLLLLYYNQRELWSLRFTCQIFLEEEGNVGPFRVRLFSLLFLINSLSSKSFRKVICFYISLKFDCDYKNPIFSNVAFHLAGVEGAKT